MPTNYPASLDNLPRPSASTTMDATGYEGDVVIDSLSDAVEAVQAELGTDPAGAQATVKARLEVAAFAGWTDIHWPQTGIYYRSCCTTDASSGTFGMTANRLYYYPFWVPSSTSLAALAVEVTAEVASSNVRMGLYSATYGSTGLVPSSLVVDAGTASTGTTGLKDIATTQAVTGGTWYFVAAVFDAAVTVRSAVNVSPLAGDGTGTMRGGYWYQSFTYGALPSSPGTLTSPTLSVQKHFPQVKL